MKSRMYRVDCRNKATTDAFLKVMGAGHTDLRGHVPAVLGDQIRNSDCGPVISDDAISVSDACFMGGRGLAVKVIFAAVAIPAIETAEASGFHMIGVLRQVVKPGAGINIYVSREY